MYDTSERTEMNNPAKPRRRRSPTLRKASFLSVRVEPELREALQQSATEAGLTLSEEISQRLQGSLDQERTDTRMWGRSELRALFRLCGVIASDIEQLTGRSSFEDPATFLQVEQAVRQVFRQFAPTGTAEFEKRPAPVVGRGAEILSGEPAAPSTQARQMGAARAMITLHEIAERANPKLARDIRAGLSRLADLLPRWPDAADATAPKNARKGKR